MYNSCHDEHTQICSHKIYRCLRYVNINGRLFKETSANVPYNNRSFRFGFGLFETMLLQDKEILLKEYHWERLFSSMEQLGFSTPELMSKEWLEEEVLRTVKRNKLEKLCRIRLQIYAGRGGLFDGQYPWSEFVIECQEVDPALLQLNQKGLITSYTEGLQKSADSISNYKSSNAMIYSIAARQTLNKKIDDAIIVNTDDHPIETTIANIFCIQKDKIYTPALSQGCVNGVMRKHIIKELSSKGFSIEEKAISRELLEKCDSVFATNAIRRVKWIAQIGKKEYKVDKVLDVYENINY